jgi:hypothetical protein
VGSGVLVKHKVTRKLNAPQNFTPSPTKEVKEMKIIDIEISSSGMPPAQTSPKIKVTGASSSVANRETIEDGKSSETIFSGRNMPDAYNTILRPRGVEIYETTAIQDFKD